MNEPEVHNVTLTTDWTEVMPGIEMLLPGPPARVANVKIRFTRYDCGCGLSHKHFTPEEHEAATAHVAEEFYVRPTTEDVKLWERHRTAARGSLRRLLANAFYASRTLARLEPYGHLPGDHLAIYVNRYQESLAALDALKELHEVSS